MSDFGWHVILATTAVAVIVMGVVLASVLRHLGAVMLRLGPETYGRVDEGPILGTRVDPDLVPKGPGLVLFLSPTCSLSGPSSPSSHRFAGSRPRSLWYRSRWEIRAPSSMPSARRWDRVPGSIGASCTKGGTFRARRLASPWACSEQSSLWA